MVKSYYTKTCRFRLSTSIYFTCDKFLLNIMSPTILVVVIIDISVFIDYKDKSRLVNNYKSALN